MSNFLSTPVFHAHRQAQAEGLPPLARAAYFEVAARLFGYENYRLMERGLARLETALSRPDAAVIFAEWDAIRRAAELLKANPAPTRAARRYVAMLIEQLSHLAHGRSYSYVGAFWFAHLDPYVPQHFLRELEENSHVREVHAKVQVRCQVVLEEDTDEIASVWPSREIWQVWSAVAIYPRRADGEADIKGEYLLAQSTVAFQKLDRAVVSIRPEFSPASATANRYHAGMGGEVIR